MQAVSVVLLEIAGVAPAPPSAAATAQTVAVEAPKKADIEAAQFATDAAVDEANMAPGPTIEHAVALAEAVLPAAA